MDDLKSLLIGIAGGVIVLGIARAYRAYRRESISDDIKFLEYEKSHLEAMKRSSVEMNRSSFRAIFALLLLLGLAHLIPRAFAFVNAEALSEVSSLLSIALWAVFVGLCFRFWQRYDNLKNYRAALAKMDQKLEKLQQKLENS